MSPRGRRSKSKRGTKRPAAEPLPKFGSLKEQEAFYASHDFSALFDAGEEVESNAAPTGRLRGRKPQVKTERGTREMRLLVPMQLGRIHPASSRLGTILRSRGPRSLRRRDADSLVKPTRATDALPGDYLALDRIQMDSESGSVAGWVLYRLCCW